MAKTNEKITKQTEVSGKTLREMTRYQKIANDAVQKAQEENRRLGIPNWYSINGRIVSDVQIETVSKKS